MKRILIALALFCALFSGCDKDEPGKTIFKFTLGVLATSLNTTETDDWIIVHDNKTGELIGYKSLESSETVTFETDKVIADGTLSITYFQVSKVGSTTYQHADTYLGIPVSSEWIIGGSPAAPDGFSGGTIGTYPLKITGIPSVYSFALSDRVGLNSSTVQHASGIISGSIPIREGATRQLISIDRGLGNPKYTMFENLTPSSKIDMDFADLKEFDKVVKVNFPPTKIASLYIIGYDGPFGASEPFVLYNNFEWGYGRMDRSDLRLGFLDSFPNYAIYLAINSFSYVSRGPAPASIEYIDNSAFSITNRTLTEFAFTATRDYNYRVARYANLDAGTSLTITYHAPPGDFKHPDVFPDELKSKYIPALGKLKFTTCNFILKGPAYADYIAQSYKVVPGVVNGPVEIIEVGAF